MLIEDLTGAAEAAIESAAAEGAKAAALAALEREAAALNREAAAAGEAARWRGEYQAARRAGMKRAVLTGVIGVLSGFAIGAGGVLILQGGK